MHRHTWLSAVGIVCLSCLAATGAAPQIEGESEILLRQALRSEIDGDGANRKELLQSAVEADPQNKAARWHSGQVEHEGQWTDYATVPGELAKNAAIDEYRTVRSRFAMTRRGQLELADWCRDRKLPQRERAHLTAALALSDNPDDPVLRARLGFKLIDGVWTTQAELTAQQQAESARQQSIKGLRPRVQQLAKKLDARRKEVRRQALDELRSLDDPEFIPVLETVLIGSGLERERLLVELLSGIESHKAADALARVAVFSTWDVVRQEAARALHVRPIEAYAPELIRSLRTPIDSRISLYVGAGGVHLLRSHVSETQHTRQQVIGRSSVFLRPVILSSFESPADALRARNRVGRTAANAAVEAELKGYAAQRNAELQSDAIDHWNDRICTVLNEATGADLPVDARQWWTWWYDYNQVEEEEKEDETRYEYEERTELVPVADPTITPPRPPQPPQPRPPGRPRSCLVAGTPVWTDRGSVAIEDVQIGDLVLSKDAESGELSYRPVLQTTVRNEQPIVRLTTERGEIRGTGGHTFWISGRGWTKLRLFKPGERVHGADGPVEVIGLEPAGEAKTYNLIVADSHTYFAGAARLLSHDVTFGEPVDAVVPGMDPR